MNLVSAVFLVLGIAIKIYFHRFRYKKLVSEKTDYNNIVFVFLSCLWVRPETEGTI